MRTHSNTILVTGAGGGIGRGLAEAFHELGNHVILGGRREEVLLETCAANPGMRHVILDVTSADSIQSAAQEAISKYPKLNCVINNAGVQRAHDFSKPGGVDEAGMRKEI